MILPCGTCATTHEANHQSANAKKPWSIPEASTPLYIKLLHDNRTAEISTWFSEQSLMCSDPMTAVTYICPEDFGGHDTSGPASLWSLQELRAPHGRYDASRERHFHVASPQQMFKDRSEYSQIFRDYKIQLNLAFLFSNDSEMCFITMDHSRNLVGAVRRTLHALEFHPTLSFTLKRQNHLESFFGSSVSPLCAVRRFPAPLRMEILRLPWHTTVRRLCHSRRLRTLGQKSTSCVAASRTHQALPSRLHGRYIHFWFLHRSRWCVGPLHGFAYGDTSAVLFVTLGYPITCAWM